MELILIQTLFYNYYGLYYAVQGDKLIQFDKDYYLEFKPGNEVYADKMRVLKKLTPISQSEGEEILNTVSDSIKKLTEK